MDISHEVIFINKEIYNAPYQRANNGYDRGETVKLADLNLN